MKRYIWIPAFLVVAASLFFAVRNLRTASHVRTLTAGLAVQNKNIRGQIAAAQHQLDVASQKQNAPVIASQPAKENPTQVAAPSAPKGARELADLLQGDPALRTLFQQRTSANCGLRYKPFYDTARLSPQQIDRFEALLTEAEQDKIDLRAAAKSQGLAASDPSLKSMWQQNEEMLQAAEKELLGETNYQALQRYNRLEPLLAFTTNVALVASETDTPLTSSQCQQLLDVIGSTSSKYLNGGKAEPSSLDTPLALQKAEQIITPSQLVALRSTFKGLELWKLKDQYFQQKNTAAK